MDMTKFIDLHVHVGPEILKRKYTPQTLVTAEKGRIAVMALKNHMYSTVPLIEEIEKIEEIKDLRNKKNGRIKKQLLKPALIGSVVLNNFVGGLNPEAVRATVALSKTPVIVWFPTVHAKNFLEKSTYEIPPEWVEKEFVSRKAIDCEPITVLDKTGKKLSEEAIAMLNTIKNYRAILATGHLSWQESELLVKQAIKTGIKNVVLTHPIYQLINMPVRVQKELTKNKGVYAEQSWSMWVIDKIPIKEIARQIRAIGADKCIMTSDTGQINSPSPSNALRKFAQALLDQGISEKEIRMMGIKNPQKIIKQK